MLWMTLTVLFHLAGPQDGPIRTAPPPTEAGTTAPDAMPAAQSRAADTPRSRYDWGRIRRDAGPALPRVGSVEDCRVAALRGPDEAALDCAVRFYREAAVAENPTHRSPQSRADDPEGAVPEWALTDSARWETRQCGATGDDACRRRARNRLALARAGLATDTPTQSENPAPVENCRMVMRRSETGFGGSLTRVCSDGADAEAALDRLESVLRPF